MIRVEKERMMLIVKKEERSSRALFSCVEFRMSFSVVVAINSIFLLGLRVHIAFLVVVVLSSVCCAHSIQQECAVVWQ